MKEFDKPLMILSLPFTGSAWLQSKYVDEYNTRFNLNDLRSLKGSSEFFRWDNTEFRSRRDGIVTLKTREEKINFLETERVKGNEYMYRCKFFDLYNYDDTEDQIYLRWFKEFYINRYYIIKLQKKDVWTQFANMVNDFYDHPANITILDLKEWITRQKIYEGYHDVDDIWYTEDLTDIKMSTVLNVNSVVYTCTNDNGDSVNVSYDEWYANLVAHQSEFIKNILDGENIKEVFDLYYNNWESKYNVRLNY